METIFQTGLQLTTVMESEFLPLSIDLKVGLIFPETDPYHEAVALERVRFILMLAFNDTILINRNSDILDKLKDITATPILECWDEPWDQFIALMIYYKLSAILEDKGFVDSINIAANTGDGLEYTYFGDELNDIMVDDDMEYAKSIGEKLLWYNRNDLSVNNFAPVELTWEMIGLTWDKKKSKKQKEVNNIKQFTPKIIK